MDVLDAAQEYLNGSGVSRPLFVAFDSSSDLTSLVAALSSREKVRLSDFCHAADALPDLDALCDRLAKMRGKAILLGLGEYAALAGDGEVRNRIFGLSLRDFRLVVPVWGGHEFLAEMAHNDPRIQGRRGVAFAKTGKHWTLRIFRKGLVKNADAIGFKALLRILEDGRDKATSAVTAVVPLNTAWCRRIDSAYEVYKERHPQSPVTEAMFTERQWMSFLDDERIRDDRPTSADSFLRVIEGDAGDDPYLAFVASGTRQYSEWRGNLLCAILDVPADDKRFARFYDARKEIVSRMEKPDVEEYIRESRRIADPAERIPYMTDCTPAEREEIVRLIVEAGAVPASVEQVYPLLWGYWRNFAFSGDGFSDELTRYFQNYKRQKLLGRIEPSFMETVRVFAEDRPQFALPTRESVLEGLDADGAVLCWIDALGCEFLGLVQSLAERLGLRMKVTPARAKLPSITSVNRSFYDEWKGEKMPPVSRLDKIKHGDFERCGESPTSAAIGLPYELNVVEEAMKEIASRLRKTPGGKVVLTSDHGATRLAVISNSETVWELPEKGKHGGRCCRKSEFDGTLPACVTESDDEQWHVLAGYDRFKGGRKGDVEVHGGASLEEMVVPVVEFGLLEKNIRVRLVEDEFKVTFRDKEITLQLFCASALTSPSVRIGGNGYAAIADGGETGRYRVRIPKPAAGEHVAVVYDGDTKIDEVRFSVMSGGAQIKKDDFF